MTGSQECVPEKSPGLFSGINLAMTGMTLIWGINFMAIKYTLGEMLPMVFASIRFSLAATFLVAVVLIAGQNLHFHRYDFAALVGV